MLQWIKIDVMIDTKKEPPFFVGSQLRGALGVALKSTTCINPSYKCEGCFAANTCVYYSFYESQNHSHPFRLDIRLKPKNFDFSLYLFEEATEELPYILSALKKMIEEQGLGKEREKMKLKQLSIGSTIVYDGKSFGSLDRVLPNQFETPSHCTDVELTFTMPIRVKQNNTIAQKELYLHTLINSIQRRVHEVKQLPFSKLSYRVEGEIVHSTLTYVKMQRYSNRQHTAMQMGGLKGSMQIKGLDAQSYRYLKLGEILGAGKQTAFGLGSYRLKDKSNENSFSLVKNSSGLTT